MKIKFENGSILESIESNVCKRSKRAIIYYYKKNPYKFIEDFYGVKLHWYQKIWIKSMCLRRNGDNYGESRREDRRKKKKNS